MTPRSRKLFMLAGAVAAVVLGYVLLRPAAERVEMDRVERGVLEVAIEEEGETRIHPRHVVAAPIAGRLLAVELHEGDAVGRGEIVARLMPVELDPREQARAEAGLRAARAALAEARARLAEAAALLEMASRSRERSERLAQSGQLSADALERERTAEATAAKASDAAGHRAEAAACEVEAAQAALLATRSGPGAAPVELCSPLAGRVLRLFEQSERTVSAGTPILEIGDPAALEVVVDVLSADAVGIRPAAKVRLEAGSDRPLAGRVRTVEPAAFTKVSPLGVEEQRVNVVVDLEERPAEIGDRYRVLARIVVWRGEDVLKAPAGAVFRHDSDWAVFVVEGGRARLRPVAIGHRTAQEVEIVSGVTEGEAVILYPSEKLTAGRRVEANRDSR